MVVTNERGAFPANRRKGPLLSFPAAHLQRHIERFFLGPLPGGGGREEAAISEPSVHLRILQHHPVVDRCGSEADPTRIPARIEPIGGILGPDSDRILQVFTQVLRFDRLGQLRRLVYVSNDLEVYRVVAYRHLREDGPEDPKPLLLTQVTQFSSVVAEDFVFLKLEDRTNRYS